MKISFATRFFHHDSVDAYTDRVVDSLVVHHTETVVCDVDRTTIGRHSKVVWVVVHHPSYEEVSCDVVVQVDIHDGAVVRSSHHHPTRRRGIPPYVDLVVAAMHHVMEDREPGIHEGHDHIPGGNDNNEMNPWNYPMIHSYQNYFVLRRPPVMPWMVVVGRSMVVPTIPIDCHIPTDRYRMDHS